MNISASNSSKNSKKAKKSGKLSPQERFQREWKRVQNLQVQNERLRSQVDAFAGQIIEKIRPAEMAFAEAKYALAEKLLQFAERKSLGQWQREQLLEWIQQVLLSLNAYPFASELDLDALYRKLGGHIDAYFGVDDESTEADEHDDAAQEGPDFDEVMDDLFAEFVEEEGIGADGEHFFDDMYDEQEQKDNAQEQSLNQLLKSSSINKMFRQIASAIHPDRERDADLKAKRNQLMSELAQARDDKDIPKIFTMYAEHVGASPLDFIGEDIEKVVTLLKRQADRLRGEKEEIIYANPLHGAIYERFNNKSEKKIDLEVNKHIAEVNRDTHGHIQMIKCLRNLGQLKSLLEERAAIELLHGRMR